MKDVARIIKDNIRESDFVARFGGDEFCLLITGVNEEEAYSVIEKIRKKIENTDFNYEGNEIKVTVSAGVTTTIEESLEVMLRKADNVLYESKHRGKNQTSAYSG